MKQQGILSFLKFYWLIACTVAISCSAPTSIHPPASDFSRVMDSVSAQPAFSKEFKDLVTRLYKNNTSKGSEAVYKYYNFLCGYYHLTEFDQGMAMRYADSLLYFANKFSTGKDQHDKRALANIAIGDIYLAQQNYNLAYYHYYLAKSEASEQEDLKALSEYSYRLGMVLYKKKQFTEAAQHFLNAFNYSDGPSRSYTNFCRRQELLSNAGLSYTNAANPDSALYYFKKAEEFIDTNEPLFPGNTDFFSTARAVLDGNKALTYALFDKDKATLFFLKSIALNCKPGHDVRYALSMQLALAELYASANKDADCRITLLAIQHGLDTIPDNLVRQGFYKLNWLLNSKHDDAKAAYPWLLAYQGLTDTLMNTNHSLTEADILGEIKRRESETRIEELEKNTTIVKLQLIIAGILFAALLAFVIILLRNRKRAKRHTHNLEILNTHNKKQNQRLRMAKESLEHKDKEKDRLLQVITHDLRNPIAGIKSLANLMKIENAQNKELVNVMEVIERGCQDALKLINNILVSSTQSLDQLSNANATENVVNINKIIEYCNMLLYFQAHDKKIHIETNLPDKELYVSADSPALCRVISNLVTNAIKFSPSGKQITINVLEMDNDVQIEIQDQGIGIPDYLKTTLFTTSKKSRRPGTQGERSYGMGLSICKEIIETYNGKIWFDSFQDKGSSFFISLPKLNLQAPEKNMLEEQETV